MYNNMQRSIILTIDNITQNTISGCSDHNSSKHRDERNLSPAKKTVLPFPMTKLFLNYPNEKNCSQPREISNPFLAVKQFEGWLKYFESTNQTNFKAQRLATEINLNTIRQQSNLPTTRPKFKGAIEVFNLNNTECNDPPRKNSKKKNNKQTNTEKQKQHGAN